MTIREAAEKWVGGFNAIPLGLMEKAYGDHVDDIREITMPCRGDRVYCYGQEGEDCGEITCIRKGRYTVLLDDGKKITVDREDFELERESAFPMWGTMWTFDSPCDNWWLESEEGIQAMSNCGFRVYECDELEYVFGIDGAGYDFYSGHWAPLYKARGLEWHDRAAIAA